MIGAIQKLLGKLPLQTAITIPFVLQVMVAVGAVAYLSYRNSQVAVNDLASQVRSELTARVLQQFEDTLLRPSIINQLNASALEEGDLNLLTGQGEYLLWQQMNIFSPTNMIYCATEADGAFLGVGRSQGGTGDSLHIQVANPATGGYFHYYTITGWGQRGALDSTGDQRYDPRQRPWYEAARQAGQATWSKVYLDFETLLPTITASIPIYIGIGEDLLGVCATDIILTEELNGFLQSLHVSPGGMVFVLDPEGQLIASSTPEPIVAGEGESTVLLRADQSSNPLIRGTVDHLLRTSPDLNQIKANQTSFRWEREQYFLQTARFTDPLGLDWIVALVMPEDDVMALIKRNHHRTLGLYLVALLLTGLSGWIVARWVTQPLEGLSDRARAIARGQWEGATTAIELERSDAIGDLSRSFATMAQQLKELFTSLEHRVEERNQELIQLNQELQRLAHVDGLTKAANRRYFDAYLLQEWRRSLREQQPLSIIFCDADYFKCYNDTYGHQAGDECLRTLAQVLIQGAQRPADLVARYGGEEFALILPHTDLAGAVCIAQTLCTTVWNLHLPHQASPLGRVTLSLGVATAIPTHGHRLDELIALADQALYTAKSKGRNGYCIASGLAPSQGLD
jgi:diguanylate cyclase (GGDEF)-like protein